MEKIKLDFKDSKYATGRRKTSIAKVWLKKGSGKIYVNGKNYEDYFKRASHKMQILRPFEIIEQPTEYDVRCQVIGGGHTGQAGALVHGISRALLLYDDNLKLTKVNTSGDEIWTRNLDNTENIIPADLTISSETIYYGCHTGREGAGDPFDYTCISLDTEANINWIKHYANPRGYSLEHIRNELYGIKANESSIYMFGGTGDESNYSAVNPPYESSDVWNGWVLQTDFNGDIIQSDVFCHDNVNTATEYGDLTEDGYVIFNDTDAQGDTEVGVIKVQINNNSNITKHPIILNKTIIKTINILGQEDRNNKNQIMFEIYNDGSVSKKFITD